MVGSMQKKVKKDTMYKNEIAREKGFKSYYDELKSKKQLLPERQHADGKREVRVL